MGGCPGGRRGSNAVCASSSPSAGSGNQQWRAVTRGQPWVTARDSCTWEGFLKWGRGWVSHHVFITHMEFSCCLMWFLPILANWAQCHRWEGRCYFMGSRATLSSFSSISLEPWSMTPRSAVLFPWHDFSQEGCFSTGQPVLKSPCKYSVHKVYACGHGSSTVKLCLQDTSSCGHAGCLTQTCNKKKHSSGTKKITYAELQFI